MAKQRARFDAVLDSGATRTSIAEETLERIKGDAGLAEAVIGEHPLAEPLSCGSVARDETIIVTKAVCLRTTFVESAGKGGAEYVAEVYYLVLPGSSEELILGWPTLCRLGFVATKHYIELQAVGLRYPTILPKEAAYETDDSTQFLSAAYHEALRGPEGGGDRLGPVMRTMEGALGRRGGMSERPFGLSQGLTCLRTVRWWKAL